MKLFTPLAALMLLASAHPALAGRTEARAAIVEADALVEAATRSDADELARRELERATDHLLQAKVKADDRDWRDAEDAAIRAQRDAEVAAAKAKALRAEAALNDIQETVRALRTELERSSGAQS